MPGRSIVLDRSPLAGEAEDWLFRLALELSKVERSFRPVRELLALPAPVLALLVGRERVVPVDGTAEDAKLSSLLFSIVGVCAAIGVRASEGPA